MKRMVLVNAEPVVRLRETCTVLAHALSYQLLFPACMLDRTRHAAGQAQNKIIQRRSPDVKSCIYQVRMWN
jgi:hypothetical protein